MAHATDAEGQAEGSGASQQGQAVTTAGYVKGGLVCVVVLGVAMGWFSRNKQDPVNDATASKTFWLSFADEETGRNLGVCVIDVSPDIAAMAVETAKQMGRDPAGAWLVAAIGLSVFHECNPGGSLQGLEVDPARLPGIPRNRLIQEDELKRNGWA